MKNKENKKWSFAHFCAYISLALSFTMLVLWCCNAGGLTVVSLDSFVGVIVALLAIIVTLAIAWQIYSSIELKDRIEELNVLRVELKEQERKFEQLNYKSSHLIAMLYGDDSYDRKNNIGAFYFYMCSLQCTMQLDEPINYEQLLDLLKSSANYIKKGDSLEPDKLNQIREWNECIRKLQNYHFIKDKYASVYNDFISKVKL